MVQRSVIGGDEAMEEKGQSSYTEETGFNLLGKITSLVQTL